MNKRVDHEEDSAGTNQQLKISKNMTVGEIAQAVNCPVSDVILYLLRQGIVCNKNKMLPDALIMELGRHYSAEVTPEVPVNVRSSDIVAKEEDTGTHIKRAPVVVVVGHVDHGKTSLLDYIRKTRVAQKEKGGITQHLGAYKVVISQGEIVFLDTPGHEAFTMMRVRGVRVADLAILVIAADDGIMPQTVEAIKHAQAAKVPLIVALNKVDKVDAKRVEEVKAQLSRHGLMIEEWGGDTMFVPISAKTGAGIDKLLEMIALQTEVLELKARTTGHGIGYVLEAKKEKGHGSVATVILQHGTVHVSDFFIAGVVTGRINVLVDTQGKRIKEVGPATPFLAVGFDELAQAGDIFKVISADEYKRVRFEKPKQHEATMGEVGENALIMILKADTDSSKEALLAAIEKLAQQEKQEIAIVQSSVGAITESDIELAVATRAVIYSFCVKPEIYVQSFAKKRGIEIRLFYVIYHLLDELKKLIVLMREPQKIEKKTGEAIVRKVFDIKGQIIAGCYVKSGKVIKGGRAVIWRMNKKLGEGTIQTLQREKRAMKEVATGFECGFVITGFSDFQEEDRIECFVEETVQPQE